MDKDLIEHFITKRKHIENKFSDIQDELAALELRLAMKNQEFKATLGPHEMKLEESLKKLGMGEERYLGKDNFTGNRLHRAYKSVSKGDETIVDTFNDEPVLKEKFLKLLENLSKIDSYFSIANITPQQNESMARECELFLEIFSIEFPEENLIRNLVEVYNKSLLPFLNAFNFVW